MSGHSISKAIAACKAEYVTDELRILWANEVARLERRILALELKIQKERIQRTLYKQGAKA